MFSPNKKRLRDAKVAPFLHIFIQVKRCYKDLIFISILKNAERPMCEHKWNCEAQAATSFLPWRNVTGAW